MTGPWPDAPWGLARSGLGAEQPAGGVGLGHLGQLAWWKKEHTQDPELPDG